MSRSFTEMGIRAKQLKEMTTMDESVVQGFTLRLTQSDFDAIEACAKFVEMKRMPFTRAVLMNNLCRAMVEYALGYLKAKRKRHPSLEEVTEFMDELPQAIKDQVKDVYLEMTGKEVHTESFHDVVGGVIERFLQENQTKITVESRIYCRLEFSHDAFSNEHYYATITLEKPTDLSDWHILTFDEKYFARDMDNIRNELKNKLQISFAVPQT